MTEPKRIPTPLIGLLANIFQEQYTHAGLENLFLESGAPDEIPEGTKPVKVQSWLRRINREPEPLVILAKILEDFLDAEPNNHSSDFWSNTTPDDEYMKAFKEPRDKIMKALQRNGLQYVRGGHITGAGSTPTLSLKEQVHESGLAAVDTEIRRALENIEKDPFASIQFAGNALEAVFKTYLEKNSLPYSEGDTLSALWKKVAEHVGMRPKELDNKDLKKIVSGLNNIVDGIMHLRNKKSSAHGKSDSQLKSYNILPRHARLAVHSSHTVASYILEVMEQ